MTILLMKESVLNGIELRPICLILLLNKLKRIDAALKKNVKSKDKDEIYICKKNIIGYKANVEIAQLDLDSVTIQKKELEEEDLTENKIPEGFKQTLEKYDLKIEKKKDEIKEKMLERSKLQDKYNKISNDRYVLLLENVKLDASLADKKLKLIDAEIILLHEEWSLLQEYQKKNIEKKLGPKVEPKKKPCILRRWM